MVGNPWGESYDDDDDNDDNKNNNNKINNYKNNNNSNNNNDNNKTNTSVGNLCGKVCAATDNILKRERRNCRLYLYFQSSEFQIFF